MNTAIKPDTMNILCGSTTHYVPYDQGITIPQITIPQIEPEPSIWEKIKSCVKEFCETFRPLVEMIVPLVKEVVLPLINVFHDHDGNDKGVKNTNVKFA